MTGSDWGVGAGLRFQPDQFFLAPTRGHGVVRNRGGRLIGRCAIVTEGRWDHAIGATLFDETYAFDDGRVEVLNWTFRPDPQGRMIGREASVKSPVRPWFEGDDYRLRFQRPGAPPLDRVNLTYDARFTLMEPRMALKSVRLKLFGFTVAIMTAFHRRQRG
jgi:hypothetical protein